MYVFFNLIDDASQAVKINKHNNINILLHPCGPRQTLY